MPKIETNTPHQPNLHPSQDERFRDERIQIDSAKRKVREQGFAQVEHLFKTADATQTISIKGTLTVLNFGCKAGEWPDLSQTTLSEGIVSQYSRIEATPT